jgi:hypothetical protein
MNGKVKMFILRNSSHHVTCSGSKSLKFIPIDSNFWPHPVLSPLVTLLGSPSSFKDFEKDLFLRKISQVI